MHTQQFSLSTLVLVSGITLILGALLGSLSAEESPSDNHHTMESMMHDMTSRMEQASSTTELEKIFLEDMIVHHQGAVAMAELLAERTERPELQKMASDIITVQTKEIDMMHIWLDTWFPTAEHEYHE